MDLALNNLRRLICHNTNTLCLWQNVHTLAVYDLVVPSKSLFWLLSSKETLPIRRATQLKTSVQLYFYSSSFFGKDISNKVLGDHSLIPAGQFANERLEFLTLKVIPVIIDSLVFITWK